jgi:hypothetical protein
MKTLYLLGIALFLIFSIQTAHASTFPSGCTATSAFSSTTGHPCTEAVKDCDVGDLYSAVTGRPCTQQKYLPGCTSTIGYSVTTGSKCDGAMPLQQISQQLNQIIQNTSPATATPDIIAPTPLDPLQITVPTTTLSGNHFIFPIDLKYSTKNVDSVVVSVTINGTVANTFMLNRQIANIISYPSATEAVIHYDTYLQPGSNTISINADGMTQTLPVTVSE